MSEDSNLPTPPPSPEERPVQPGAEGFNGGLEGDSWLLDVGPEPGTEYEEHESVPALPLDWDEGAPAAGPEPVVETPEAAPVLAEGFDVFEESEVYGEAAGGYEDFGDGGEASFIEPAPRSRPMVEAILPGTLAMLLSFGGIAVWSFLRTPTSFNENVELARSEHEIHFTPDDEVQLAKPLQLPTTAPTEDRVAGWMELGQTADDLSEPDELGYASSTADEEPSYASAPTGPESAVVATVDPVTPEAEEASPESNPAALTVLEALGAADSVITEPAAPQPVLEEVVQGPVAVEAPVEESEAPRVVVAEPQEAAPAVVEPEPLEALVPAESEPVASLEPLEEPAPEPMGEVAEEVVEERSASGNPQEALAAAAGEDASAFEVAGESDVDVASVSDGAEVAAEAAPSGATAPLDFEGPRPFQGPGVVPEPLEPLSDGPLELVAEPDELDGIGADSSEPEPGAFASSWLMALVAPALPVPDATPVDAPTLAQVSLPEPDVQTAVEAPADPPAPFDWTARSWAPEVAMSAVDLPEPYEPRVVEIEVFDAVEDEVAVAEVSAAEEVVLSQEVPSGETPSTDSPSAESTSSGTPSIEAPVVAALGWPSDWPSPWDSEVTEPAQAFEPEVAVSESATEPVDEPTQSEVIEVAEVEVAATEVTGPEEVPAEQADAPALVAVAEPAPGSPAIADDPSMGEEPAAAPSTEQPALEEVAFVEPDPAGPTAEEFTALEQAVEEPVTEVAAAEPTSAPEVDPEEPSGEVASLTAIGWPSDWPMAWDDQPMTVVDPAAVAAAEAPEENPGELDGIEPNPEPEAIAEVTAPQPEPNEPSIAAEESAEVATLVAADGPAAELDPVVGASEALEVSDAGPETDLAAATEDAPAVAENTTAENTAMEALALPGEHVAPGADAPSEETLAAADPAAEEAATEPAEATLAEPLDEPGGDVAQAASSEEAEAPAAVAFVGPAQPEFAPVLLPPSPDQVSDLHADLAAEDHSAAQGSELAGQEVAASIPVAAARGSVEAELETVSSAGAIPQDEVAVEVVGSLAEEAPTRRRRQLLERIEDERYWRFKSVPSRKFNDDHMVFTPNVGAVRVVLKGGEAFDGRLHSVGQGKIMLDTKMGRMAVDARRADRVDRITDDRSVLRGPATMTSTSGLKRVKVKTDGGVFYGHLVSREGKRVTLLMDEGFRITLESNDVTEAADRRSGRLRRVEPR